MHKGRCHKVHATRSKREFVFATRKYCSIAMFLCKAGYRFGSTPAMDRLGTSPTSILRRSCIRVVPKSVISEICKSTFVGSPAGDVCSGPPASLSVHAKHGKDDSSSSSSILSLRFPKPEGPRFRRQYFECLVVPSRPALSFAVAHKQQRRVDSRQGFYGTARGRTRWIAMA